MKGTAVALAAVALCACGGGDDDAAPSTTTTAAAVAVDDLVRTEITGGPDWLAADDEFVYVKRDSGAVDQVDPATGEVLATFEIGENQLCQGIGAGFGSVWTCFGTDVVRIDPATGEIVATIEAGKTAEQGHLGIGFDRVWVLQGDGSTLVGIDPTTNELGEPLPLEVRGADLIVDDAGIWVVSALEDALVQVDPSGALLHRVDGLTEPRALSLGDGVLWVADTVAVHDVDPATGTIRATYEGGIGRSGAVAADESGVWVRRGAEVRHLDGATGSEDELLTLDLAGPSPGDMIVAFDAVWTAASEDAALFRIADD
jgi:DNA-binding beta-propeller fold protein YncE